MDAPMFNCANPVAVGRSDKGGIYSSGGRAVKGKERRSLPLKASLPERNRYSVYIPSPKKQWSKHLICPRDITLLVSTRPKC